MCVDNYTSDEYKQRLLSINPLILKKIYLALYLHSSNGHASAKNNKTGSELLKA